jgi:hygromycin-B 7''-O-kinase
MFNVPSSEEFVARFHDPVWIGIGKYLFDHSDISVTDISRDPAGESVILLGDDRYVLKIYRPWKRGFDRETAALDRLSGKLPVPIPEIIADGELDGYKYLITTALPGRLLTRAEWVSLDRDIQSDLIAQLADILRTLHSLEGDGPDFDWPSFIARNAAGAVERQRSEGANPEWIDSLPGYIERNLPLVQIDAPHVLLHGDVHFGNLRIIEENGKLKITGLAPGVLMFQGQGELQREFFRRYGYSDADINEEMRRRMMMLTILYEWSSLRRYAERLAPEAVNFTLEELERTIWNFA